MLLAGLRVHAQLFGVFAERVHQAGGRRDRIPGRDGHAAEDRAQRRRRVAVDEHLAGGLVRLLYTEVVALDDVLTCVGDGRLDDAVVQIDRACLALEVADSARP